MLTQWRLENFKSVYDKTTLDLAPLTLFAGVNSSGKSTFIQAMLMVAQTVTSRVERRPVVLNGHLTRLGTFDDIASTDSSLDEISVGFTVQPRKKVTLQRRRPPQHRKDEEGRTATCPDPDVASALAHPLREVRFPQDAPGKEEAEQAH